MRHWLFHYRREHLAGDLIAGAVVAMMMIPQGMAYALLVGLPPATGLYASLVPCAVYALIGTSSTQSVGPMAVISLMTGAALAPLAAPGSGLYLVLSAQLALLVGVCLLVCGLLRLGFLSQFFSRPVMSGFTNGAVLLIIWGQLQVACGGAVFAPHLPSLLLAACAVALLLAARRWGAAGLRALGLGAKAADIGARLAPMLVLLLSIAADLAGVFAGRGVALAGEVPRGLPALNLATSPAHWHALLQPAALIAFIVFVVSMSSAQALAIRRRETLLPDRELLGLGAANIGSALAGGFPVTGGLSRSAVNAAAGAHSQLASLVAVLLLGLALYAPTGWLALMPLPVLAATILVAVANMLEWGTLAAAWRYDRADALALLATFGGVLLLGVQSGVLIGVALSMATLIWRESRPHIAVLGRVAGTEHFRNVQRFAVETQPGVLLLRVDADLFFANTGAVTNRIEQELERHPATRHLVLVLSAVNGIDTSALFALEELNAALKARGIGLHFAEVKGPVMDRLRGSRLLAQLHGRIFLSTAMASTELGALANAH
ncbi:SulP family inorganic anion transporter [Massilia sp. TS11]|uniref:SulP family inorganic anion transporter n=1 Tax=Massilia sp. TS11 TaxID=2908003 RepID=UPI001EDA211A|nr:SulP family inorganic anion transporter [Massilia sp. TS11]MCG2584477.1 SulP family inorganic anion transporter [Massilia sp. TS11]